MNSYERIYNLLIEGKKKQADDVSREREEKRQRDQAAIDRAQKAEQKRRAGVEGKITKFKGLTKRQQLFGDK